MAHTKEISGFWLTSYYSGHINGTMYSIEGKNEYLTKPDIIRLIAELEKMIS